MDMSLNIVMHAIFFQVEPSRWTKHEGALPGVDYAAVPAGWTNPRNAIPAEDKEAAWNAFQSRPMSRAEAGALREIRISRGRDKGTLGDTGRSQTGDGRMLNSRRSGAMPYFLLKFSRSPFSREAEENALRHSAPREASPNAQLLPTAGIPGQGGVFSQSGMISLSGTISRSGINSQRGRNSQSDRLSRSESESQNLSGGNTANSSLFPDDSQGKASPGVTDRGDGINRDSSASHERDRPVSDSSGGTKHPPSDSDFEGDSPVERGGRARSCEIPSIPPVSSLVMDVSSGFAMTESAFSLRGEADADNVLRTMMRLSKSADGYPPNRPMGSKQGGANNSRRSERKQRVGANETQRSKRKQQRETYSGGATAETVPSGGAGAGTGAAAAARDRPAAGGGLVKGATPAIKSGSCGNLSKDAGKSSVVANVPGIEGRHWGCEERMIARGSRKSERRVRTTERSHDAPSSVRDRRSAPHGRRNRRGAPRGNVFVPVLSKSATTPRIGLMQSIGGGDCSTASLNETLLSFGFTVRTPSANNAVSSTSQQPYSLDAATISDPSSDSTHLVRRGSVRKKRGSTCSGVTREEAVPQQPRRRQSAARPSTLPGGRRADSCRAGSKSRQSNGNVDPGCARSNSRLSNGKIDPVSKDTRPVVRNSTTLVAAVTDGKLDPSMQDRRPVVTTSPLDDAAAAAVGDHASRRLTLDEAAAAKDGGHTGAAAATDDSGHISDADDKTTGEQMSVIIADVARHAASSLSAELTEGSVPSPAEGPQQFPLAAKDSEVPPLPVMDSQPALTTFPESFAHAAAVTSAADLATEAPAGESGTSLSGSRGERGTNPGETENEHSTCAAVPSDPQTSKITRNTEESEVVNEQVVTEDIDKASRTLPPALAISSTTMARQDGLQLGGDASGSLKKSSLQVGDNESSIFVDGRKERVEDHQAGGTAFGGKPCLSPTELKRRPEESGAGGVSQNSVTKRSRLDLSHSNKTSDGSPSTPRSSTSSRSARTSSGSVSSSSSGGGRKNSVRSETSPQYHEGKGHTHSARRATQASSDDAKVRDFSDPKTDNTLPRLATRGGVADRGQGAHEHRTSAVSTINPSPTTNSNPHSRTSEGAENGGGGAGGGGGALPAVSSGKRGDANRRSRAGAPASVGSASGGGRNVRVHRRPVRIESKDLKATTEALTTHHLTVDDLLKVMCA